MTSGKGTLSTLKRLPRDVVKMAATVQHLDEQVRDLNEGFARIDRDIVAGLENLSKGFQRLDAQLASGARKPDDVARRSDISTLGQTMARIGDALTRIAEGQERTEQILSDLRDAVRGVIGPVATASSVRKDS